MNVGHIRFLQMVTYFYVLSLLRKSQFLNFTFYECPYKIVKIIISDNTVCLWQIRKKKKTKSRLKIILYNSPDIFFPYKQQQKINLK